jgi:signal transduction histidine kinase
MFSARFPPPLRTLRQQFTSALLALAILVVTGSLIAVYALREVASSAQQLAGERLARMEAAQDLVQRTLLIERVSRNMRAAGSLDETHAGYAKIIKQLDELDVLEHGFGAAQNDVVVLVLHESGQQYRNMVQIVAQLQGDALKTGAEATRSLHEREALLLEKDNAPANRLASILFRLQEAGDRDQTEALRQEFMRRAQDAGQLPQAVLADLLRLQRDAAASGVPQDPFSEHLKLIEQQQTLRYFNAKLEHQTLGMLESAQMLSARYTSDYREAIERLAEISRTSERWVIGLLGGSLILAWLVSRYFLGKRVLARLQTVSHYLRSGGASRGQLRAPVRVPVQGDDEIGEMARAVEQFLEDRQRLAEANEELASFSYSVSHNLRTPLRAIDSFTAILQDEYKDCLCGEAQRRLDVIRSSAARMTRLVDGLIEYISLFRRPLRVEKLDMTTLARRAFEELRSAEPQRNIQLQMGELPPALADPRMIRQVLANVLNNAFKFTASQPQGLIEITACEKKTENAYCVRDNGVGFDMRYSSKLFGVFLRLHSAEEFEGSGIGLAIVKRVIERHGGSVWAEGKVGGGASVYFTLPRARSSSPEKQTTGRTDH